MGYTRRSRSHGATFFLLFVIIAIAVTSGYWGARYLLYPYLSGKTLNESEQSDLVEEEGSTLSGIVVDQQEIQDVGTMNEEQTVALGLPVFNLQYGSFSTKDAAQLCSSQLKSKGIPTYIKESSGSHKVLGVPYLDQAYAKSQASAKKEQTTDVFVSNQTLTIADPSKKDRIESLIRTYQEAEKLETAVDNDLLLKVEEAIIILMEDL